MQGRCEWHSVEASLSRGERDEMLSFSIASANAQSILFSGVAL